MIACQQCQRCYESYDPANRAADYQSLVGILSYRQSRHRLKRSGQSATGTGWHRSPAKGKGMGMISGRAYSGSESHAENGRENNRRLRAALRIAPRDPLLAFNVDRAAGVGYIPIWEDQRHRLHRHFRFRAAASELLDLALYIRTAGDYNLIPNEDRSRRLRENLIAARCGVAIHGVRQDQLKVCSGRNRRRRWFAAIGLGGAFCRWLRRLRQKLGNRRIRQLIVA